MADSIFESFDSIVVFDTETTGIRCRTDEIIELAALSAGADGDSYAVGGEMDSLIRLSEGRRLPGEITRLTGITEEMLESEGVSKRTACETFAGLIEGNTLIASYNAQFDMCFLYYFLLRLGMAEILKGKKMLDLLTVYKDRREYPHKLSDAVREYSLDSGNTHRACDDARAALELLAAMEQEQGDIGKYVNLFGYNPKYGCPRPRIGSVKYVPQGYFESVKLYEKQALQDRQ